MGTWSTLLKCRNSARIHHTVARIYAVTATKELVDKLKVKRASPLLKMMHTAYDTNGQPVYCSISYSGFRST